MWVWSPVVLSMLLSLHESSDKENAGKVPHASFPTDAHPS